MTQLELPAGDSDTPVKRPDLVMDGLCCSQGQSSSIRCGSRRLLGDRMDRPAPLSASRQRYEPNHTLLAFLERPRTGTGMVATRHRHHFQGRNRDATVCRHPDLRRRSHGNRVR